MKKRFADRGDEFYCASVHSALVIERYHVLSNRGERFQWMGPCSQGSGYDTWVPDFLHETPEKAFEAAKKRRVENMENAIKKALQELRVFRQLRDRTKRLRAKDIKVQHPETFERRLRDWDCDF